MGNFPKNIKPKTYIGHIVAIAIFVLNTGTGSADSGQKAFERGAFGAAAAQFLYLATRDDPVAQNNLGVLYLNGDGVPRDYALARSWFEKAAALDLAGAMFNLGMVYLRGYGVQKDLKRSTEWFERAANGGDRDAQFFFGLHLFHGRGVERDPLAGQHWFQQAAEKNLSSAQYNLALMLLQPETGERDEPAALELLHKAAAQGHESADITIGRIHLAHDDDPARAAIATEVFKRLAEHGNADAQVTLGMIYTFGQGTVAQDFDEGRFWLKLASNQESGTARLNLGNIYAQGIGVDRDLIRAYAWYSLSAERGDSAGEHYRDTLAKELDEQELEAARILAIELVGAVPPTNFN